MAGSVRTVVSGVEGCVVSRVAVGGGGARCEVGARGGESRRGAVERRGIAMGEGRGVGRGVRGGRRRTVKDRGACEGGRRPSSG